jgi:lipopolysaccharide kinase (Kdo/WaaP) family protein
MGQSSSKKLTLWVVLAVALLIAASGIFQLLGSAALDGQAQTARRWQSVGFWLTVAALIALVPLLIGVVGEMIENALGPVQLEDELAEVAENIEFQSRMKLLAPHSADGAPWSLKLRRVISERQSHLVFEVDAVCGGQSVLLWGKRYRLSGFIKSLQRFFLPSYDAATWHILCAMHTAGLNSPAPLVKERMRRGGVPVGTIILAQHIGAVTQVRNFIRSDFVHMPPERRRELVEGLGDFVARLHSLDIYDFTPRYFWASGLDGGEIKFYLFDLDKAHLLRSAPRFIKRYYRLRGTRRLRALVEQFATSDELAAFDQRLEQAFPTLP